MVHVVSCRFLRLGCSEEEHPLFKREYARYRNSLLVVLLRCFPHCCPGHIERSYCGCSIHLLVTFSDDVSSAELDELLVCTRFEPSHAASLLASSLVSLIRNAGAVGDEDKPRHENDCKQANEDSVWLRAQREMQHDLPKVNETALMPHLLTDLTFGVLRLPYRMPLCTPSITIRTLSGSTATTAALFVDSEKWHTISLRTCSSFLVTMLVCNSQGLFSAVVLARYASPAFSLVSFRRSGSANHVALISRIGDNVKSDSFPAEQQHKAQISHSLLTQDRERLTTSMRRDCTY
ncbi:hypothetical protein GQ600_1473 [Phytophthora cactorum]|nr:hypothetical protein GQ600_1473 [Phytophthora cactorum]